MLAILYDIHGNRPALAAVLEDARARGVERYVLGGDYAAFGPWGVECVELLRGLPEDTVWLRGNWERWQARPEEALANAVVEGANAYVRAALGPGVVEELGALPESARVGSTLFTHASPLSDMDAFAPDDPADDARLLAGVDAARVIGGHSHLQFSRTASDGATELVNPGSVGLPWDGDTHAAYATLSNDTISLHRVAYDLTPVTSALSSIPEPWATVTSTRLSTARFA